MNLLALFFCSILGDDLLIETSLGAIQGVRTNYSRAFYNIPFAPQPKRFEPSELWTESFPSQPYNATSPGNCCFQPPNTQIFPPLPQSEDCLNLNVFLPKTEANAPLPVLVYIHGGAFVDGCGANPLYTQTDLMNTQNVVFVTINYRLGIFGQFAIENDDNTTSGLLFLSDQMNALKWVKAHIANFGGDPDNVTLFGESAGGISVCLLTASPKIQQLNLFNRAGIMSGPCHGPWGPSTKNNGVAESQIFLDSINSNLEELRQMNPKDLLEAKLYSDVQPSIGNVFLTKDALEHFQDGLGPIDSLIIGHTGTDGTNWQGFLSRSQTHAQFHQYPEDWNSFESLITKWFPLNANSITNLYKARFTNATEAYYMLNSDVCVRCPTQTLALSSRAKVPTFYYNYMFAPAIDNMAPHASDIILLFKTWSINPAVRWVIETYDLFDNSLANIWQRYFGNFGRKEDPNSEWTPIKASGEIVEVWNFYKDAKLENDDTLVCQELQNNIPALKRKLACMEMGAPKRNNFKVKS